MTTRDPDRAVYVISVAAELAGLHAQTLRVYERKGLVDPSRTQGGSRRYSERDIQRLQRIQTLTDEGLNLAGVKRVLELEAELELVREQAQREIERIRAAAHREVEAVRRQHRRDLVPLRQELIPWADRRPRRPGD